MREELGESGFAVVIANGDEHSRDPGEAQAGGGVRPRLAAHVRLDRPAQADRPHPRVTDHRAAASSSRAPGCVPYSPGTYAWWQVVTISLTQADQGLVVIEPSELETWPLIAAEHGVTAASGTPTFWRQTIYRDTEALAKVPLEQITLGGEPVDQAILDRLQRDLPAGPDLLDLRVVRGRCVDRGPRRPGRVSPGLAGPRARPRVRAADPARSTATS